jgi:hypothetical protein
MKSVTRSSRSPWCDAGWNALLAHFAARVLRLDLLDAALDLADFRQVLIEAGAIRGAELPGQP